MINVLAKEVEEEPIAHCCLLHHQLNALRLDPDHHADGNADAADDDDADHADDGDHRYHTLLFGPDNHSYDGNTRLRGQSCLQIDTKHTKRYASSLSVTQLEEVGAEGGGDAESKSVDDNQGSEGAQDEHPEPEEDVDLLVEDVDGQDAERVVLLQLPG